MNARSDFQTILNLTRPQAMEGYRKSPGDEVI